MSIYHPDHMYSVTIFDNQDRMAKKQFLGINCVKYDVPLGVKAEVLGKCLMVMETKGSYVATQQRDERTGQERSVRQQWMPRFQIQVHEDVSVANGVRNIGPIPAGAVLLDRKEPVKVDLLADAKRAVLSPETAEGMEADEPESVVFGPYDNKLMPELRTLCTKRGIKIQPKNTREELMQLLVESDNESTAS